jgi:hypothetical protein
MSFGDRDTAAPADALVAAPHTTARVRKMQFLASNSVGVSKCPRQLADLSW